MRGEDEGEGFSGIIVEQESQERIVETVSDSDRATIHRCYTSKNTSVKYLGRDRSLLAYSVICWMGPARPPLLGLRWMS